MLITSAYQSVAYRSQHTRRSELKEAFKSANLTLKKRWQECSASHADKIAMAMEHSKRMEPYTKNDLLKNLERKMDFLREAAARSTTRA